MFWGTTKYEDVTTEFAVRATFCDLAIKCDGKLCYLIEVKSIGTDLKDNHLRQAVDYGSKEGCEWVILTNGQEWQAHRIKYEQPVTHDEVFRVNLLDPEAKLADIARHLYLISKETSGGKDIDRFWRQKEATSRFVIAQVLLHDNMLGSHRRELRKLSTDVKITKEDLAVLLRNEVLKRETLDGEKAEEASSTVKRLIRRRQRQKGSPEKSVAPSQSSA
jgi:predicted type IV restriction endonuclease